VSRQCELLGVPRSSHYGGACKGEAKEGDGPQPGAFGRNRRIYTEWPFYGSRRIAEELRRRGCEVNRKRIQRLMRIMGIMGVAPGPTTSRPHSRGETLPLSALRC
jgi:putative transposase